MSSSRFSHSLNHGLYVPLANQLQSSQQCGVLPQHKLRIFTLE
jgi:hypothetical protein